MSLGEDRVRVTFNPSARSVVDQIKQDTARLIDACEQIISLGPPPGETVRLVRLAQTAYEEAAMWAVKAATAST
jgi:hypothetical protein